MYLSVCIDILHSAADFHWLGEDGIAVLVVDDEGLLYAYLDGAMNNPV